MLTVRLFLIILVTLLCRELSWESQLSWESALLMVSMVCVGFAAIAKLLCAVSLCRVDGCHGGMIDDPVLDRWHGAENLLKHFGSSVFR